MSKIVKVPVLPYTHKMMLTFYGIDGIIGFDADSFIGSLVKLSLEKIDFNLKAKTVPEGTIDLKFKLPYRWADMDLSPRTSINLGQHLDKFFGEAGAYYYMGLTKINKNTQEVAQSFINDAGLRDDMIDIDSAKKKFFRRCVSMMDRNRKNKKKENYKNFNAVKIPENAVIT